MYVCVCVGLGMRKDKEIKGFGFKEARRQDIGTQTFAIATRGL